jgi:hypothetical protein
MANTTVVETTINPVARALPVTATSASQTVPEPTSFLATVMATVPDIDAQKGGHKAGLNATSTFRTRTFWLAAFG